MSLPWIELHVSLPRHRKSVHLGLTLGDERAWTYMAQLWLWCGESCPTGKLTGTVARQVIECAAGWKGQPGVFADAAVAVGFIDELPDGLLVHGWPERAEAHIAKLERDAERAKERRAVIRGRYTKSRADVAPTSPGRPPDVVRTSVENPPTSMGTGTGTGTPTHLPSEDEKPIIPFKPRNPAEHFFAWAQSQRVTHGLVGERPPKRPEKLSVWFSEAMSELNGDEERLRATYSRFTDSKHWANAEPPWPFGAFITQWRDHVPIKRAATAGA